MRKKIGMVFLALALLFTVGCRVREISDPTLADAVIETVLPEPEAEEPEESPEEQPEEEQEPPQEPEEPPNSEEPQEPEKDETAEEARPETAGTVSDAGTAMLSEEIDLGVSVTYDPNGGDGNAVSTIKELGSPYGPQPEAVRRGWRFEGWYTAPEGGVEITAETIVETDVDHTLYAHWQPREANVITFDPNGGRIKSAAARLEISEGDAYGELPVPTRDGYDLNGWFTLPEEGEQILPETVFSGEADVTLYAQWTYNPYKFWAFTLKNRTQQVYICQQVSIYYEGTDEHITAIDCPLITATGSFNIAENRDDPNVTDDWVQAKKPDVVLKRVSDFADAASAYDTVSARFPDQKIIVVSGDAVSGDSAVMLYSQLCIAKLLYADWYADVDLAQAAGELEISGETVYTG